MIGEEMIERMEDFKMGREISVKINTDDYTIKQCKYDIEWAENIIKALEELQEYKETDWISANERLPEKTGEYICTVEWHGTSTKKATYQ